MQDVHVKLPWEIRSHQQIGLKFKEDSQVLHLEHNFYGAEIWTLRKIDQKYLESFGMWFWRTLEKISWIDPVRNEELRRVNGERNIIYTVKKKED